MSGHGPALPMLLSRGDVPTYCRQMSLHGQIRLSMAPFSLPKPTHREVWEDTQQPGQSPSARPDRRRTRVCVSESRRSLASASSTLSLQRHQQQRQQQPQLYQQQLQQRYWHQQCHQHLQQLQSHDVLPTSASSPVLSAAPAPASQRGSAAPPPHSQKRRGTSSDAPLAPGVPPSCRLSSADLMAAGAAASEMCGERSLVLMLLCIFAAVCLLFPGPGPGDHQSTGGGCATH